MFQRLLQWFLWRWHPKMSFRWGSTTKPPFEDFAIISQPTSVSSLEEFQQLLLFSLVALGDLGETSTGYVIGVVRGPAPLAP